MKSPRHWRLTCQRELPLASKRPEVSQLGSAIEGLSRFSDLVFKHPAREILEGSTNYLQVSAPIMRPTSPADKTEPPMTFEP
jgi:hypothetical protein